MSAFGACASLLGIIGVTFNKPNIKSEIVDDETTNDGTKIEYLYSTNNIIRKISYILTILGMGMVMSPIVIFPAVQNVLPGAMLTTGLIACGSIKYFDKSIKNGEIELLGPALNGALYGLVGCGVVGLGSYILLGPNSITLMLSQIDTYAGIPLFALLIVYDTWKAKEYYKNKNPDHMGCSLDLYLDLMNLLTRLINLYSKNKD